MNTRIQVEPSGNRNDHRRYLIKEQLRVAAGQPLSIKQDEVVVKGHAVMPYQRRSYPNTFLPSPGLKYAFPRAGWLWCALGVSYLRRLHRTSVL